MLLGHCDGGRATVIRNNEHMMPFLPYVCEYARETFHTLYAFLPLMPPSTSIHGDTPASSHICLSLRTFSTWYSMNFCPPKPGFTAPREELSNTIWFDSICLVSWGVIGTQQTTQISSVNSENAQFEWQFPTKSLNAVLGHIKGQIW